jgi:REP element-mobilizing transposase RayT
MKPHQYSRDEVDKIPTRDHRPHPGNPDILLPVRSQWRRLRDVDYRDPECWCLVTVCTKARERFFSDHAKAAGVRDVLLHQCIRFQYRLHAYVIMPDHVHLVVAPGISGLSIGQIVGKWKGFSAKRLWALGVKGSPWQCDFDDRVLRSREREGMGLAAMIAYVMNNPVRAGLAKRWEDYAFCDCFVDL